METNESPTNKWAYPELVNEVLHRNINRQTLRHKTTEEVITEDVYQNLIEEIIKRNKLSLTGRIPDYYVNSKLKLKPDSVAILSRAVDESYFEIRRRMNTEQGRENMARGVKNRFERNKRSASRRRREKSARRRRNAGKKTKSRSGPRSQ